MTEKRETAPLAEKTPATAATKEAKMPATTAAAESPTAAAAAASVPTSKLIEFPGTGQAARPQWRKELSERVREIQQRRMREAEKEGEPETAKETAVSPKTEPADAPSAASLGLVPPPPDPPQMNPIVAAALRRIERARQTPPPTMTRVAAGGSATATATARIAEESYEQLIEPTPVIPEALEISQDPAENNGAAKPGKNGKAVEGGRASSLSVVSPQHVPKGEVKAEAKVTAQVSRPAASTTIAAPKVETTGAPSVNAGLTTPAQNAVAETSATQPAVTAKPTPRRVIDGVVDDAMLARLEAQRGVTVVEREVAEDDFAPLASRFVGGIIDMVLVAFFSSPFAAIIELTNGNWSDLRVVGSMAGIVATIVFLYLTAGIALAGRTWGMAPFHLRVVHAETANAPTVGQAARRSIFYILTLVTFGLGLLSAFFDAERRTAHDHLSGTIVIRD